MPGRMIIEAKAKVVEARDTGVVVELRWRDDSSDEEFRLFQTLRMRDGLVFDMKDFRQGKAARRALR